MINRKETLRATGVATIIGVLVPALIGLGIFAQKSDVEQHRSEVAREYESKEDALEKKRDMDKKLDLIYEAVTELRKDIQRITRRGY